MVGMHEDPRPALPRFRVRLGAYRVASYLTGVLLILLVVEMVLKYGFHLEVDAFGASGPIALVLEGSTTGLNLSLWVLIVHGWFYVVYLLACYVLWQSLRWPLWTLLAMAAGGVVPFMSFVTEQLMVRRARRDLDRMERKAAERAAEERELAEIEAGLSERERAELDAEVAAEVEARLDAERREKPA